MIPRAMRHTNELIRRLLLARGHASTYDQRSGREDGCNVADMRMQRPSVRRKGKSRCQRLCRETPAEGPM